MRDSGELKYSLLNVRAIKVHALLASLPFNVDWEYCGGKCQLVIW